VFEAQMGQPTVEKRSTLWADGHPKRLFHESKTVPRESSWHLAQGILPSIVTRISVF